MIRTWFFPLIPFVYFGCSEEAGGPDSDTWLGVAVEEKDAAPTSPGLLLPVRYDGAEASVVVQVSRALPDGGELVVAWGEVVDGTAVLALPARVAVPEQGPTGDVVFRIVARRLDESGAPTTILDVSDDSMRFDAVSEDAAGTWYVNVPTDDTDKPLYLPPRRGATVGDRLVPVNGAVARGNVAPDLDAGRFGIALLTDAEAYAPVLQDGSMTTNGAVFSAAVRGAPPPNSLRGDEGPTSGRFWPVAWADVDGLAGFDPAADDLVGVACASGGVYTLVWQAPPADLPAAADLVDRGIRVGWATAVEGQEGLRYVAPAVMPWMSTSCM